ncbi:MAG: FG-GAP-like repeat-containing protein [Ignavibacteria bacterium]
MEKIITAFVIIIFAIILFSFKQDANYENAVNIGNEKVDFGKFTLASANPLEISANRKPTEKDESFIANDNKDWYSEAMENIRKSEYNISQISQDDKEKVYQSPNRANNIRFIYSDNGFTAKTMNDRIPLVDISDKTIKEEDKKYKTLDEWSIDFKLQDVRCKTQDEITSDVRCQTSDEFYEKSSDLSSPHALSGDPFLSFEDSELKASGNKASIENENIRIDYTNTKEGMRQDFIIKTKPEGDGKLRLNINAETELKMIVGADALMFKDDKGNDKMRYSSLKVWDATGKELRAYFEKNELQITNYKLQEENRSDKNICNLKSEICNSFSIVVNDEEAEYPITIDPVSDAPDWTYDNNQASSFLGWSVAAAGDVNGDGYGDVIIGAPYFDNGQTNEGRAYVFHGSATGVSTFANWIKENDTAGSYFGNSVATAGDINGDGYSDVIIGAPDWNSTGKAYVFHGSATGLSLTDNWQTNIGQATAKFGCSVSTAGDINNDGYSDVIVGAYLADDGQTSEGRANIYLGSASGLSTVIHKKLEVNSANANFGQSVSFAGDVNGDGYSDVIIGAHKFTNNQNQEGRAYIYKGSSTGIDTIPFWFTESNQALSLYGISVSTAGDVNGDGLSDVIVGASAYEDDANLSEGHAFVYYGNATSMSTTASWSKDQDQASALFGFSVSTAGDVNGDGYADIIIGGFQLANGQNNEGIAYLYFGSSAGLSDTADWKGEGDQTTANYGYCVSTAGDVNGDGFSDIVVGSPLYDNGETNEGRAFLYYGYADGLRPTVNWEYEINQTGAYLGECVSSAGDVNGDGYSDVIIGAQRFDNGQVNEGSVFVFYGSSAGLSVIPNWNAQSNQDSASFGYSVSSAGDINGDGYSDVIVGAHYYDNGESNEGRVFAFYGSSAGLSNSANWTKESNQAGARFGVSVSSAGDVNGDGFSDVIVGADRFDNGESDEGWAFVFYGSATGLSDSADWTAESNQMDGYFGRSVSSAGDVNGDGFSDVIVGAPFYSNGQSYEGRVFAYYGSSAGLSNSSNWTKESNQMDGYFGYSVSSAGDVNGDGYSDVIIGAYGYDNGESEEGRAFAYYGSAAGLSNTANWLNESNQIEALFGWSVSSAGDVNGDGYSDVIIGARYYGGNNEGRAYVYYGSATGLSVTENWTAEGNQGIASFGVSVSFAGDVNGDGYSDVIVGASQYDNAQVDEGKAFVYYGNRKNGLQATVQQYKPGTNNIIGPGGNTGSDGNVKLNLFGKNPFGRSNGKIVYEHKENGQPFSGSKINYSTGSSGSGNMTDLGTSGIQLNKEVTGLQSDKEYKWRARVQYDLAKNPYQKFGPWKYYNNYSPIPGGNFKPSDGIIPKQLNLTMLIQGFYNSSTDVMVQDTVIVYLRNSTLPYAVVDSAKVYLNSSGTGVFSFQNAANGVNYFLHLKHRNSIETWSKTAQTFTANSMTYNFTTANAQAFGDNQINIDASPVRYGIYSGDVNQDGTVDLTDGSMIDNDAFNFASGYFPTDVNGDGIIDLADAVFADNNGFNFVSKITP